MNKEEIKTEDILNSVGDMFDVFLDYVDNSNNELEQLQQENQQLKDNWNKLKEWLKYKEEHTIQQNNYYSVLNKMQELEKGDSNE